MPSRQILVQRLLDLTFDHARHRRQHQPQLDLDPHLIVTDHNAAISTAALEGQGVTFPAAFGIQLLGQLISQLLRPLTGRLFAQLMVTGNVYCRHGALSCLVNELPRMPQRAAKVIPPGPKTPPTTKNR